MLLAGLRVLTNAKLPDALRLSGLRGVVDEKLNAAADFPGGI